ncbi:hypothetical protein DFQ30_004171 [Apophysomyces sp. BC1015]|nr:hypothetical protein DFQ30_004171 [Apophysomyces sp. BC1015]
MAGGKKRQCPTNTLQQKGLEFFFNRQRKRQQQLEKTSDSNAADEEKLVLRQPKPHESTAQIDPLIQKPSTASAAVQDHKTVEGKDGTTLMKQQLPLTQLAMSTSVAAHDNLHELLLKDPMVFKPEEYHVQTWMTATGVFAPYSVLAQTFAIIMSTTARTRMINVLCNLLRLLIFHAPADLLPALWLCSNSIGPSYEGAELGIGSHILIKSLADVSGTTPRQLRKLYETHGDWGDVAYAAKTSVRTIVEPQPLCIRGVLDTLHTVAASRGKGVVGTKTAAVKKLLLAAKGEEARFIVRTLIGNLRVGALRTTVLTSLARACVLTQSQDQTEGELIRHKDDNTERILFKLKRAEAVLKECYAQCPNWNAIVPWLLECGDVSRIFECCGLTVGKCNVTAILDQN